MNAHRQFDALRRPAVLLLGGLAVAALVACGGGSSPTEPGPAGGSMLSLTGASVLVNGQSVGGLTIRAGQGASTRFEARLSTDSSSADPLTASVRFSRPLGMGMMGGASGTFPLYDDGTHGDHLAGDHLYAYEDFDGLYGCNMANAAMGDYHYEFFGDDGHGDESPHMTLVVTLAR
jgi:hypothetical protein